MHVLFVRTKAEPWKKQHGLQGEPNLILGRSGQAQLKQIRLQDMSTPALKAL